VILVSRQIGDGPAAVVPIPIFRDKCLNKESHYAAHPAWEGELRSGESENLAGYPSLIGLRGKDCEGCIAGKIPSLRYEGWGFFLDPSPQSEPI